MKKHNFYAGPSILPEYTKQQMAKAVINFAGTDLSLMEISHRSKEFQSVIDEAMALVKELLQVPEGYSVLFLQGGASLQFLMAPFNLLKKKAAYVNTGSWSTKAIKESKYVGETVEVASSKDKNFSYIPKNITAPADADYLHITTNNTIYGTEFSKIPEVSIPLVGDMSSDILSRSVDVSKYDLIYAGAQKNLGPSGATLVIVKDSALGKTGRVIPTMLDYNTHISKGSMFNTPSTMAVFGALQTLKWLKSIGGVPAMEKINKQKSALLYNTLDESTLFNANISVVEDRSRMNVTFVMAKGYESLEQEFLDFATLKGMVGIKGHRSVGGFRASLYNALPLESVQALVDTIKEFEAKH